MLRKIERSIKGYVAEGEFYKTQREAYEAVAFADFSKVVGSPDLARSLWAKRGPLLEALQMPITVEDRTRAQSFHPQRC